MISIPCMDTKLVDIKKVISNDYNPNNVAKDKMKLLKQSILDNGFCFPIVTIYDDETELYVIIDGFHRYSIATELKMDKIPVVVLEHDITKRMAATIQFNKARGVHAVDLDAELIRKLIEQGQTELQISKHLGIDLETVYRYKQTTGIIELFKNVNYSKSWEWEV